MCSVTCAFSWGVKTVYRSESTTPFVMWKIFITPKAFLGPLPRQSPPFAWSPEQPCVTTNADFLGLCVTRVQ